MASAKFCQSMLKAAECKVNRLLSYELLLCIVVLLTHVFILVHAQVMELSTTQEEVTTLLTLMGFQMINGRRT